MNQNKIDSPDFDSDLAALLKEYSIDISDVSDGYHTYRELYAHRNQLFITLLKMTHRFGQIMTGDDETKKLHDNKVAWKSLLHSDATMWNGWFVAGIGTNYGDQITYHLPIEYWDELTIPERERAPKFDGHSSRDVIRRLAWLVI